MLLYVIPLFHPGLPKTHDGFDHAVRIAAFEQAIFDKHIPPRWAGNLNYGYGSPVFNFYYPLPQYLGFVLRIFGLSYEVSLKIIFAFGFLVGPIGMFFFLRYYYKNKTAFLGSILFGVLPYRFLNLYVRGDVGETLALGILPWIFYFCTKLLIYNSVKNMFITGLSISLLILSHNFISLISFPLIILYVFIQNKPISIKFLCIGSIILGLFMSFYFWFPAYFEQRYTHNRLFASDFFKHNFLSLQKILFSPWKYGTEVNGINGLSPEFGIHFITLFICSSLYNIYKRHVLLIITSILVLFFLFLTTPYSSFVWQSMPIFPLFQFPWRFMSMAGFLGVLVLLPLLHRITRSNFMFFACIFIVCIISIRYSRVLGYEHHNDSDYRSFRGTTFYHGEATTIWSAGDPFEYSQSEAAFIEGAGIIKKIKKNTIQHEYFIDAFSPSKIVDFTLYYPGWNVYVNGNTTPIEYQNPEYRGLLTFEVPEGTSTVLVIFQETKTRTMVNLISLATIICCILYISVHMIRNSTTLLPK